MTKMKLKLRIYNELSKSFSAKVISTFIIILFVQLRAKNLSRSISLFFMFFWNLFFF